jgi:hypothetical protein
MSLRNGRAKENIARARKAGVILAFGAGAARCSDWLWLGLQPCWRCC